jgi:glycine/D-amino acid oxidase-like deaminating enzyme
VTVDLRANPALSAEPPGDRWDLVVIGGGYWGSALAALAREGTGWSVLVVDDHDEEGASRNSAGYVRWEWLEGRLATIIPEWWEDSHTAAGAAHLGNVGARHETEQVKRWNSDAWDERPGLLVADPWLVLEPSFTSRVRLINRTPAGWQLLTSQHMIIKAHRVAICAGAWTDALLQACGFDELGVEPLIGSAILAQGQLADEVVTYVTRPYHHVTARRWDAGLIRVGETVSKQWPDPKLGALVNDTAKLFPGLRGFQPITGRRPMLPELVVKELGDGLVVATGGHRIGLALAGGVAMRALEVIR